MPGRSRRPALRAATTSAPSRSPRPAPPPKRLFRHSGPPGWPAWRAHAGRRARSRRSFGNAWSSLPPQRSMLAERSRLSQPGDFRLTIGELAQDLVTVLADRRRRAGGPRSREAEADRIVDRARDLAIGRLGDDARVAGLLVVDHVGDATDHAEGDPGGGEGRLPFGIGSGREDRR